MCILFIAIEQHPDYPLIIAANRDEFYARPTVASALGLLGPNIIGGQDKQAGGSWMGANRNGHLAALTNIRDPARINDQAKSRGALVQNYLNQPSNTYLQQLQATRHDYNGYNLLYGHWQQLSVYNNFRDSHQVLLRGCYGLSNDALNTPWPKTVRGIDALASYCRQSSTVEPEELFGLLSNQEQAPVEQLPDTGIGAEWEQQLSSIFIQTPTYGTRSSTLLLVDRTQQFSWFERSFNDLGETVENVSYSWSSDD